MTDEDAAALPAPPSPTAPLRHPVSGAVRVVTEDISLTIRCPSCGQYKAGSVRVDGPDAFYVCAQGHSSQHRLLEAVRARYALTWATPEEEPPGEWDFRVVNPTLPADLNPIGLNLVLP